MYHLYILLNYTSNKKEAFSNGGARASSGQGIILCFKLNEQIKHLYQVGWDQSKRLQ